MRREQEAKRSSDADSSELDHSGAVQGRSEVSEGWWVAAATPNPLKTGSRNSCSPWSPSPEPAHLDPSPRRSGALQTLRKQTASAADGSEEASPIRQNSVPLPDTEPDVFLFLLSTLVWHPRLTDGHVPPSGITGHLGRGNTSSLASPALGLQINRLTIRKEDETPDRHTHHAPARIPGEKSLMPLDSGFQRQIHQHLPTRPTTSSQPWQPHSHKTFPEGPESTPQAGHSPSPCSPSPSLQPSPDVALPAFSLAPA